LTALYVHINSTSQLVPNFLQIVGAMGDSPALRPECKTAAFTHGEIGVPNSDGEATAVQHIGSFNPGPPDTDQPAHRSAPASTVTNSEVAGEHIAQHAEQTNKLRPKDGLSCPRCQSTNTKFCYYNNYNTSQPRYICKVGFMSWCVCHGSLFMPLPTDSCRY
jgi:hypothetical protein